MYYRRQFCYIYIYVCVCVCVCVCACVYIYICMYIYIYSERHFCSELGQGHFSSKTCHLFRFSFRAFSKTKSSNSNLSAAGNHGRINSIQGSPVVRGGWEQRERSSSCSLPQMRASLFSNFLV